MNKHVGHVRQAGRFLLSRLAGRRPARRPAGVAPRPAVELLESRDLPSVFHPTYLVRQHAGRVGPLATPGPTGTAPAQVRHAYGFDQVSFANGTIPGDGRGTTIAIVDAYDDPNIAGDLHQFDVAFGLSDPVFTKVNQNGGSTAPAANAGWAGEIALDVEWAHAIAPQANILLVEANSNSSNDLFAAVRTAAAAPGVVAVSMSWGGGEFSGETGLDGSLQAPNGHAGVTFLASSGDSGAPASYPSASPNVVSVGGTTLRLDGAGNILSESGWGGSGGGVSTVEAQPAYQGGVVTQSGSRRATPDVAYDADPNTGFPVYDTVNHPSYAPWGQYGGTSDAAPQWAALIAIADQGRALAGAAPLNGPTQTLPALYQLPAADFHDITTGSSTGSPSYAAGPGYDLVTGRGSPVANLVVSGLVSYGTDLNWSGGGLAGLPANADTSTPFTVTRTYNVSGVPVGQSFAISYYASASGTPNPASDTLLATETVSTVAGESVGTHSGSSPALQFLSRGTWYVYAYLDSGNTVQERDETNNIFVAPQPIAVTGAAVVHNGDAGYSELGPDWQDRTTPLGYGGVLAYAPAGSGQDTASWQVGGLAPGTYDVSATWYAYPNRATNAPYSIYDGSTLLATVAVNQQLAPSGTTVNGFQFQSLGQFTIQNGTLKVVLSNNANGYVFAEAVRVAQAPAQVTAAGPAIVNNGQAGYTESGPDWQDRNTSLGYGGVLAYAPAGTGQDTASWQVTALAAGTYEVDATWYAYANRATNAPYSIYDGNTLLATVTVNQQQAPSGVTVNGFPFQSLGTFGVTSGTLKVVLSNKANGYVFAEAVRFAPYKPTYIVDNGQAGYTELGPDWQDRNTSFGYGGNLAYAPAGTGQDTATWQLTGLAPGSYDVQTTWYAYANRADNASFSIYDGNTLLATVTVNQQLAPSGTSVGGFQFQSLGQFTVTSGTLRIVLSNNADGYVFADAVRVVQL